MITLLSPAKKLLTTFEAYEGGSSQPLFTTQTETLITILRKKSVGEIAGLMDLSDKLARLNFERYRDFILDHCPDDKAYPALFYFQGDVYQGLKAKTWSKSAVNFAQQHLLILSGLYGVLRPLDLMQAYRLEMGTRLANPAGETLYDFWRVLIAKHVNQVLAGQTNPMIINLASSEYSKVVDTKLVDFPVIDVIFYENTGDQMKIIGIHAKKARGTMAAFIMENEIDELNGLKDFVGLGYAYRQDLSSEHSLVFVR